MHRNRDVVPRGFHEVVTETGCRREPDRVEHAVDAAPLLGKCVTHIGEMVGHRDIEFVDVDGLRQLAGDTLGQAQRSTGTGQHDVGTLLLREGCHPERQRGIGEDAGDHDVLAVEQTHASDRSHAAVLTLGD